MLDLKNIYLSFQNDLIVDGTFQVRNQQITVLSGISGCGKSTLLYDIALITHQAKMHYEFDGQDISLLNNEEIMKIQKNKIAFVFQNLPLFETLTLMENIKFFSSFTHDDFDEKKARQYLTDLQLCLDDDTKVSALSGGERQRLAIVCALMKDAQYIILDEPTAYLDEENKQRFLNVLNLLKFSYHKTILITSHDQMLKDCCDNLYEIQNQRIICKKREALNNHPNVKELTHCSLDNSKYFLGKIFYKNKWSNRIFQLFMIAVLVVSNFFGIYLQYYKEQVDINIKESQSSQIVVDIGETIDGEILRELNSLASVQTVKKIIPLQSDNAYLICPYIQNDYFSHYIRIQGSEDTGVYMNYETFRQNKTNVITCQFGKDKIQIRPQFQLGSTFEDYKFSSSIAKVMYIPYDDYKKLFDKYYNDKQETSFAIIELKDKDEFIITINDIIQHYPHVSILGNNGLLELVNIHNMAKQLSSTTMICVFIIIILAMLLLKLYDYYHLRFSYVLLDINGFNPKFLRRECMKKEIKFYKIPFICSLLLLSFLYYLVGIFNLYTALLTLFLLLGMSGIIFILSVVLYALMHAIIPTINVVKTL